MSSVLSVLVFSLSLASVPDPSAVTGVVVDASGRAVPRALVQVVTADGTTTTSTLSDADGSFRVANPPASCRVDASLPGFSRASAPCDTRAPMRLTLGVAPISDAIVVSATRTEAPAGQVAAAVTVFDAEDVARRQAPLLSDLLRHAPGAIVVGTGAPGSVTSMFVRGGESNYTKVLLDGVPLNEPGGSFDLSNITTANLERVELVRGANAALFGSDAMTGVLQLFTRRGTTPRPEARVAIEGGTFSTGRASAAVSGRTGEADYSAEVAGLTTDNDVPNNAFTNVTVSGAGGARLGRGAALRSVMRLERGRSGSPGQTAFGRPDLDAFYARHAGAWGVTFDQHAGAFHQRAAYGDAIAHQRAADLRDDPPYVPAFGGSVAPYTFYDFQYDQRNDLTRHHASYQADRTTATPRAGSHIDTALVDWDGERATLRDLLGGTSQAASRDNVGVSLQHQALWARAYVTAGVRVEHNASFGNATVPRVAAAWYLRAGDEAIGPTRIHGTAGTGIKEPTILQTFSTNRYYRGNPNLRPERSRAIDVGIEQRFARDRVRVDATWFDNRYRDIIALGPSDPLTFASQFFNIGLTRARGAELSGDVVLVSGLRAKAGYTYLDSKILQSVSDFSDVFKAGKTAFRRPRHSGFLDVAWLGARGSLDVVGTFAGERSDSDFSSLFPPLLVEGGYANWDVRASAALGRALSLTGAIDNLTDRRRMEPLGYPVLSRAIRGGVRLRF